MRAYRIGKHKRVLGFVVFEVVVDALLLHEPTDEVEIRLPVLDAVLPGPVGTAERFLEIGKTVVSENLLDNVRDGLVLKDAAVGVTGEKPQPGMHRRVVEGVVADECPLD